MRPVAGALLLVLAIVIFWWFDREPSPNMPNAADEAEIANDCVVRTRPELLMMFRACKAQDKPDGCITPRQFRDLICSAPSLAKDN